MDDTHDIPLTGTVDWERLARIVAESSYGKCLTMEAIQAGTGIEDEMVFLKNILEAGTEVARMVASAKTVSNMGQRKDQDAARS